MKHQVIEVECKICGLQHEPTREAVIAGHWRICEVCRDALPEEEQRPKWRRPLKRKRST